MFKIISALFAANPILTLVGSSIVVTITAGIIKRGVEYIRTHI